MTVRLLGEQVISDATGAVRMRSSRAIELVAHLAVHAGSPQTRQRLAALFWPDSSDEQALTNLRRELHHLRGALGGEAALVATPKDLCWYDSVTCRVDVRTFAVERAAALAAADDQDVLAHATAAVAQYRGEFLPGGYDDWLLDARNDLERQCVDLLDLIRETRARTGDLPGAVEAARRRIQLQPLEETGYRRLMEIQGDLGDRAGAVSTYHHCASVLERELGVEPDPSTRASLNRLLARVGPPVVASEPELGRPGPYAAQLVGRTTELDVLHGLWRTAAAGRPTLVLVQGDAGVGKTRLVAELAETARRNGAVVASAQCFGTAGRLALAPVADWLRTPAVQAGLSTLDPVWKVEVDRLVPAGRTAAEPGDGSRAMVDAWQRHRFFEGLARALIGADRPLLLVLNNLHWCDQETLAFLTFCLGLTVDTPIMVAATMRIDGDEPGLADWTARMRATGMLTSVTLNPLDTEDSARLAEAITGRRTTDADAELLQATTGGFPLFVIEGARGMVGPGCDPQPDPPAVLRNRLDQVSPTARDVAGLAAAVGRTFTLDLLTEASDLDADSVVRGIDELWRRRIVREIDDGYDFAHDLLRDVAYAQVSPPRRWLLHRRIAQGLELLHAGDPDAVAAQLAEQYERGGRGERAVEYYRRAAEVAAGVFAHGEAVRLHRAALALVRSRPEGRNRDRDELATLEAMAAPLNARYGYASPELARALERSIVLAESLGRRDAVVSGLVGLWSSRFVSGDMAAAHRTAARALALVDVRSELNGPVHFAVGGSAISQGRLAEALRHLALAAARGGASALSVGTRPDVHSRAFAAHAYWLMGRADEALASGRDAIALARAVEEPYCLAVALAYGAVTHQLRGDVTELREVVDELCDLCERYGFAYYREWALILAGWSRGDASGLALASRGVENLRAEGSFSRMPYWLSLVADLTARAGRPAAAGAVLDAAIVDAQARDDVWWLPEVLRMRAAHDDDPTHAAARLRVASELATRHGSLELARRCDTDLDTLTGRSLALGACVTS